jgi:6-pyruvoyltetrahydropterin/6-carboxytetrahydropterin synthase
MYELRVKTHFDAAHQLVGYKGKCCQLHGHRWEVEVVVSGRRLDSLNMLVDFGTLKGWMNRAYENLFDHHFLNETLDTPDPTAEFIAKWLYEAVEEYVTCNLKYLQVESVEVWESPDCSIKYHKE